MASIADDNALPDHIKSDHNVGYDPIKKEEEDTDDEEASKGIEATKARSTLDEEKELNQPTKVNVNVKDEDTDDEFSKCWISYCYSSYA